MLDTRARALLEAPLERLSGWLDRPHVTPDRLTLLGLVLGVGSAVAAARSQWWLALVLWLVSRLLDGLDGALARRRRRAHGGQDSGAGGFLDITADFLVYGSFVVGVALGSGGSLTPFLLVLFAYYVNGAAFLAFSSIAERRGVAIADGRSLTFIGGLAEGTETVFVHSLWCVIPGHAAEIAWVWAGVVALSAFQRIVTGYSTLRRQHLDTHRRELPDPLCRLQHRLPVIVPGPARRQRNRAVAQWRRRRSAPQTRGNTMPKYLVLYRSTLSVGEQMAAATPEAMQASMNDWMAWGANAGDALVDFGSPTQPASDGDPGPAGWVGGYSFLQADDLTTLNALLEDHPHKAMGTIEVLEVLPQPGM